MDKNSLTEGIKDSAEYSLTDLGNYLASQDFKTIPQETQCTIIFDENKRGRFEDIQPRVLIAHKVDMAILLGEDLNENKELRLLINPHIVPRRIHSDIIEEFVSQIKKFKNTLILNKETIKEEFNLFDRYIIPLN